MYRAASAQSMTIDAVHYDLYQIMAYTIFNFLPLFIDKISFLILVATTISLRIS